MTWVEFKMPPRGGMRAMPARRKIERKIHRVSLAGRIYRYRHDVANQEQWWLQVVQCSGGIDISVNFSECRSAAADLGDRVF